MIILFHHEYVCYSSLIHCFFFLSLLHVMPCVPCIYHNNNNNNILLYNIYNI